MDYWTQMPSATDEEANEAKQNFNNSLDDYKNKMEEKITNLENDIGETPIVRF